MKNQIVCLLGIVCSLSTVYAEKECSADRETVPISIRPGLFDLEAGDLCGLPMIPQAETITVYRAEDDTYKFANHPQLVFFKGKYYATWQATPRDEDSDDSAAVYSVSDDGVNWGPPKVIAGPLPGRPYHASGGWWTDGETLVCYILRMELASPGLKSTVVRTSTDGENWSDAEVVMPDAIAATSPRQLPNGRLIFMGHGMMDNNEAMICKIYCSDQPDGLSGWKRAELPQIKPWNSRIMDDGRLRVVGRCTEPSFFIRADGKLTMIFRHLCFNREERTYRTLASVSEDQGESWAKPVLTDMPDSGSMQCCGNLPDGTAFMVNCPSPTMRRVPLAITLSDDGVEFDRSYVIRGTPPDRRYDGKSKTIGYSYPHAMVHDGFLWVSVAVNKEDIEITRIPLDVF